MSDHPISLRPAPRQLADAVTAAVSIDRDGFPGHDHDYPDDPADYRCDHQLFIPRLPERAAEARAAAVEGEERRYDQVLYGSMNAARDALERPSLLVSGFDPGAREADGFDLAEDHTEDQFQEHELLLDAAVETDDTVLDDLAAAVQALPYPCLGWDVAGDRFASYNTPKPAVDQLHDAEVGLHAYIGAPGLDRPAMIGVASGRHPGDDPFHVTVTDETYQRLTPATMDDRTEQVYTELQETAALYDIAPV